MAVYATSNTGHDNLATSATFDAPIASPHEAKAVQDIIEGDSFSQESISIKDAVTEPNAEERLADAAIITQIETAIADAYITHNNDISGKPSLNLSVKAKLESLIYENDSSSSLAHHKNQALLTRAKQVLHELVVEEDKQIMEMIAKMNMEGM